ncbi:hypothetical protein H9L39_04526 [Fusarium oxysporum f. sp. albedinis]|nr:hypothetical protein H9L39_04526 [Fusarium oxysporum f. sp. albedinis]
MTSLCNYCVTSAAVVTINYSSLASSCHMPEPLRPSAILLPDSRQKWPSAWEYYLFHYVSVLGNGVSPQLFASFGSRINFPGTYTSLSLFLLAGASNGMSCSYRSWVKSIVSIRYDTAVKI